MNPELTIHNFTAEHFRHLAAQVTKHNIRPDAHLSLHIYEDHLTLTNGNTVIAWIKNKSPGEILKT